MCVDKINQNGRNNKKIGFTQLLCLDRQQASCMHWLLVLAIDCGLNVSTKQKTHDKKMQTSLVSKNENVRPKLSNLKS